MLDLGWGDRSQKRHRGRTAHKPAPTHVATARTMIASRRALETALPAWLIPDPVIDILLALYIAQADRHALDDDGVAAATSVRPTIARRWIAALQGEGYLERLPGSIALTVSGRGAVERAMTAIVATTAVATAHD